MDDFEKKKTLVVTEKYLEKVKCWEKYWEKCPSFQRIPLQKLHKIFCILFFALLVDTSAKKKFFLRATLNPRLIID